MKKTKKEKQIIVLKLKDQIVGYETWQVIDGLMRQRISETLDGPGVGMILHDQRCQYRTPATKTNRDLPADKYYTRSEIAALFKTAGQNIKSKRGRITHFILAMLLGTGMRASEFCGLTVSGTPYALGADELKVLGKGNKIRAIPILPDLSEYIRWYIDNVRHHLVCGTMKKRDWSQPLLLRENGKPYTRQLLWQRLHCLGIRAAMDKPAGVHRCRHSFGTYNYQSGMDLVTLQTIMGHTDINTTTIYARADRSKTRAMMKKADTLYVRNAFLD